MGQTCTGISQGVRIEADTIKVRVRVLCAPQGVYFNKFQRHSEAEF